MKEKNIDINLDDEEEDQEAQNNLRKSQRNLKQKASSSSTVINELKSKLNNLEEINKMLLDCMIGDGMAAMRRGIEQPVPVSVKALAYANVVIKE